MRFQATQPKNFFLFSQKCDSIEIGQRDISEKFLGLWVKHKLYGSFTLFEQLWVDLAIQYNRAQNSRYYKSVFLIKGTVYFAESSR